MENIKSDKSERILGIYTKLINGFLVNKAEEAMNYGVNERSIQRDIDDIRNYLENEVHKVGYINSVIYDRFDKGYRLEQIYRMKLSSSEVLAICKILLDSRVFVKDEMMGMIDRLITCCVPKANQQVVNDLISNELFHYVEPHHKTIFIDKMWDIGKAIRGCSYIEIDYITMKDKTIIKRKIKPISIMFSEYYFYLAAFNYDEDIIKNFDIVDDSFPTIYRIDRIKRLRVLEEKFYIPYSSRFEEGEFQKRIQFKYGDKLQKVSFKYFSSNIDTVLDYIPTAQIVSEDDGIYTVTAEVFDKGIDKWLRQKGEMITIID